MTVPEELVHVLEFHPEIISGAVRFRGTRVPAQALIHVIDDGEGLDEFSVGYPGDTRDQAQTFIHWEQLQARQFFGLEMDG